MKILPQIEINEQFQSVIDILEHQDHHVFITGRAGTGKSTLLNHFRTHTAKKYVVLAPTGVAALNVDGQTIHSFFRFFPNISQAEARKQAFMMKKQEDLYKALEVLIVDEISMVRCDLLDSMNIFLQTIRKNDQPFGGVRLICFGDLYQLPPVTRRDEMIALQQMYDTQYFFSAHIFQQILAQPNLFKAIELEKIYRQTDETFIDFLNGIRDKTISQQEIDDLNRRVIEDDLWSVLDDKPVILTATNAQADAINQNKLAELQTKLLLFDATKQGKFEQGAFPTDEELRIKKGARVMMVNNDPAGDWVNGSMGKVTDTFQDEATNEVVIEVELDTGDIVEVGPHTWEVSKSYYNKEMKSIEREAIGKFIQYPLRLAWAMTIHKSQGKTFDKVVIDFGRGAFAAGQAYVALSRCRTLDGVQLCRPLKQTDVRLDPHIVHFLHSLQSTPN